MKVLAVEIEILAARPDLLDHVDPFLGIVVALLVLALLHAEHLKLALVPTHDDVEPEATRADMVGCDHLLGGDHRIEQRRVHGPEHRQALSQRQQAGGPGDRLERLALVVGVAAVAFPAPDRKHEIEAGLIGQLGKLQVVRPASRPPLGNERDRASRGAIRPEQADLELVIVVHRHAVMSGWHRSDHVSSSNPCSMGRSLPAGRAGKGPRTARQVEPTHVRLAPVSYTHLDVYKRQASC